MLKSLALAVCCLIVAQAALAGEARTRLVAGGMDLKQPDLKTELFAKGAFSAGAVADTNPTEAGRERMALGGYAAYAFRDVTLSSSLKGDALSSSADLSASYGGGVMGFDGVAALKLGYEWGNLQAFSPNPGLAAYAGAYDLGPAMGDLSLTLSFTRDVTPSLSLGGFAAANRSEDKGDFQSGLRFGAGVGYKF